MACISGTSAFTGAPINLNTEAASSSLSSSQFNFYLIIFFVRFYNFYILSIFKKSKMIHGIDKFQV